MLMTKLKLFRGLLLGAIAISLADIGHSKNSLQDEGGIIVGVNNLTVFSTSPDGNNSSGYLRCDARKYIMSELIRKGCLNQGGICLIYVPYADGTHSVICENNKDPAPRQTKTLAIGYYCSNDSQQRFNWNYEGRYISLTCNPE